MSSEEYSNNNDETLPDTQPLNDDSDDDQGSSGSEVDTRKDWAHLMPRGRFKQPLILRANKMFCTKINDSRASDDQMYILKPQDFPRSMFDSFSRIHFLIFRRNSDEDNDENFDAYITDLSSNGTYVNGVLIGKDKTRPLLNEDIISLVKSSNHGFKFLCNKLTPIAFDDDLPSEMVDKYIFGKEINSGISGRVCVAYKREDNGYRKFALKVITKLDDEEIIKAEIDILKKLNHPNIIRINEYHENNKYFFICMELAASDLFSFILEDFKNKSFDEEVAKLQFYQILQGAAYMHGQRVCHRDLKLENILVAQKSRRGLIKIADFGLSKNVVGLTRMMTYVGSPNYIAPEVLLNEKKAKHTYDFSADMWSLGCILFSLLCGSPAFYSKDDSVLKAKILNGEYQSDHSGLEKMSEEVKDLLSKLLSVDPKLRPTAKEALQHPWFANDKAVAAEAQALLYTQFQSDVVQISRGMRQLRLNSVASEPAASSRTNKSKRKRSNLDQSSSFNEVTGDSRRATKKRIHV